MPSGTTTAARTAEVAAKVAAVRAWLAEAGLPAAVLTRPGSLAWIGAGLTDPIERGAAFGLAWAAITQDRAAVVTTDVEAPRLRDEANVEALGFELLAAPWHDPDGLLALSETVASVPRASIAADGQPGFGIDADTALIGLRLTLVRAEVARLRDLALDATSAVETALRGWRVGERDLALAGRVAAGLEAAGIFAACLIVGGDERVERFRHPVAVGDPIERLAMVVVVGARAGLHVALTRFAATGSSPGLGDVHARCRVVEARILDGLRPGTTYGSITEAIAEAYDAIGSPGAWRDHYQGGPIGYQQREFEIAPGQVQSPWWTRQIAAGDAVAYNPSLAGGGKIEDTFLVTDDGPELLTKSDDWPTVASTLSNGRVVARPAILELTG
jgi:Xaa-Pro aminopeptidase